MDYLYSNKNAEVLIETMQSETRKKVAEQYINCRKQKKMTQEQLAKRAGIPRTNITRFESGTYNPSLEMMVKIAAAMDMKLNVRLEE